MMVDMTIIPENIEIHRPDNSLEKIIKSTKIKEKLLFKVKSDFHDIFVVKNNSGTFLKYKDTYQAGIFNTKYYSGNLPYINYFLIPYLINKKISKILTIGLGSGLVINQYEKLLNKTEAIDIVDIEENAPVIAKKYFNFKQSSHTNFYLQDAIVYLKSNKKKYDLIIVDVAGNEGIDERFVQEEYINLIKCHLYKKGIFVSNLPSSRDITNNGNKLILNTLKIYEKYFSNINVYNGETSNKIYYKTFFNIDNPVYDITNAIIISSNEKQIIKDDGRISQVLNIDINEYLKDIALSKD